MLDLNETQTSILALVFKYCDDNDLPLLDLKDLAATLKFLASDEGKPILADYGGMSSASVGVLLRSIVVLEQEGADIFFGEPEFDVDDLLRTTPEGEGIVSVLELSDVMDQPRLFSTFMLWMLAQLYETLPEAGDLPKPKLCFFFDEAHLLFDDASEALIDQVERTARLIRSKGVGVYFVTQAPTDVPAPVLAQLGNRVQHALRAFTPDDADALRKTARTFPMTDFYDVEKTITSLGTGEALVTVLSPRGVPTPLAATRLLPPDSLMAPTRRGPVPGPSRESVRREVRRDGRPRQRLRADHGEDRGGPRGRRPQAATEAAIRRCRPDDRGRDEHDDARPAAARDRTPGAGDGRRPEGRPSASARRRRRPSARRRERAADDRHGHPDRRQDRDVADRPGPHPRRVRDAVRWRKGPMSVSRSSRGSPHLARSGLAVGGRRAGPRPSWRPSAEDHRPRGATPCPAVVHGSPDPDRWRHGMAEGDRFGPRV